jgi:polyisoprenyl-teichoic acid--peptidoglycan teichoic acid transferase
VVIVVGVVAIVAAGAGAYLLFREDDAGSRGETPVPSRPSTLLALGVRGSRPLVAVIGAQGSASASAVTIPARVTFTLPGQGQGTVADAAELSGRSFRTAISNLMGVWAHHYIVMNGAGLGDVVDRMGGIEVDLAEPFEVAGQTLGPGSATMDGAAVKKFLDAGSDEVERRWDTVLDALLEDGAVPLLQDDVDDADDLVAASGLLQAAQGAAVQPLPTESVGVSYLQADPADMPELVRSLYGLSGSPIPVIVTNGAGTPGVGESVAAKLIPAGFRIVLSENAEHFGVKETKVIASDDDQLRDAERARDELGVGVVAVSQVPSGFADVEIVVGKDYTEA